MKNISVIRKLLALVMLLIFMFSITPKKYLHDLIADHIDFYSSYSGEEMTYNQSGFDCHCEDLVVTAPFIESNFEISFRTAFDFNSITSSSYHFLFSNFQITKDSRGPPAIA